MVSTLYNPVIHLSSIIPGNAGGQTRKRAFDTKVYENRRKAKASRRLARMTMIYILLLCYEDEEFLDSRCTAIIRLMMGRKRQTIATMIKAAAMGR